MLTDEEALYDAIGRLRRVYPNVMSLEFEREAALQTREALHQVDVRGRTPMELFEDFYFHQAGMELDDAARAVVQDAVSRAQEGQA